MGLAEMFDLSGRTAVVTGCSRGIGRAVCIALAEAGADIIGTAATTDLASSEVRTEVEKLGRTFTGYQVDFERPGDVTRAAERILDDHGPVDILVNNAGTIVRSPAIELSVDDFNRVVQVDLSSHFAFTRVIAAPMIARRKGKVVFTASLLSFQGGVFVAAYAAAKSGIAGLTRALANEWAPHGVNVNAIAPGYVITELTEPLRENPTRASEILARIPAGRWAVPKDLAGGIVYLASAASDYVHGVVLPIDGGWLAR